VDPPAGLPEHRLVPDTQHVAHTQRYAKRHSPLHRAARRVAPPIRGERAVSTGFWVLAVATAAAYVVIGRAILQEVGTGEREPADPPSRRWIDEDR